MLFNSAIFALFMAIFFPLFLLVRRNVLLRNLLLCFASYVFYGWWDPRFLVLVAVSTSIDYMAALGAAGKPVPWVDRAKSGGWLALVTAGAVAFARPDALWISALVAAGIAIVGALTALFDRLPAQRQRFAWLCLSLVVNLGILGIFKYAGFFSASLHGAMAGIGLDVGEFAVKVILPVGLSFYTFQAISRTIDSYRGQFDPGYSLVNYAAYHAFFPQLVAGPIERAPHLMPQFEQVLPISWDMVKSGVLLFLWGLYMKMVVADNVAQIANPVFNGQGPQTAGATVAGVLAFTFQIYCDFAGYSNMARGLARCLGFDLMVNFNLPYFALTPSEFWRRWHISLSAWLRDYLYIPLGGSRGGELKTYRNLMATMLLGGLWHGAGWTFVFWGGFHGAIQVLYRTLGIDKRLQRSDATTVDGLLLRVTAWAGTIILVMIGWVFFRARTFGDATRVLHQVVGTEGYQWATFSSLLFYVTPLVLVEMVQRFGDVREVLNTGPFMVRYSARLAALLAVLALAVSDANPFIYFDF